MRRLYLIFALTLLLVFAISPMMVFAQIDIHQLPFEVHIIPSLDNGVKEFLLLVPGMMAMAALFVYRPEKFRALPYIVLAVLGVYLAYSTFWNWGGQGYADYGENCMLHYSKDSVFCSAVPIVILFVMQIVRAVQKKKQNT